MSSNPDELRDEGRKLFRDGSLTEAVEHLQRAMDGYTESNQAIPAAEMMNDIGVIHRIEGRLDQAADMLEKARAAFSSAGDRSREAQTLGNLAPLYRKQANTDKALTTYTQAADIFAELKDREREGEILMSRGLLEVELGQRASGLVSYESGLSMISNPSLNQKVALTAMKLRKRLLGS